MTTRYQPNQPYADDFNCELCGRTAAAKCDECNLWHCEPCLVRKMPRYCAPTATPKNTPKNKTTTRTNTMNRPKSNTYPHAQSPPRYHRTTAELSALLNWYTIRPAPRTAWPKWKGFHISSFKA